MMSYATRPLKVEALFLELMQKEEARQREVEQWWAQVEADARAFEAESREVGDSMFKLSI